MLTIMIRYFFITISFYYIYGKIVSKPSTKGIISYFFILSLITSLLSGQLVSTNTLTRMTIILFICHLSIIFLSRNKFIYSFYIASISLGISLIFYIFSNAIACLAFLLHYKTAEAIPFHYAAILSGILQYFLLYFVMQSKRFRNGLRLLFTCNTIVFGSYVSMFFITCIIIASIYKSYKFSTQTIIIILVPTFAILLLYYWQYRITQTYRERMSLANEKSLEDEIATLKAESVALRTDNQRLTQIVHKDNKLVPAMEATVLEFLQSANTLSAEELTVRGNELSTALHEMAMERKGILTSLSPRGNHLPSLGLLSVDGLLSYMENRAKENSINYRVKIADNIKELSLRTIREEDLRHLLSDLIENAIIAVKCSTLPGHISIHFGTLQDNLLIEISDNGIPFTVETYQHFGYEQCSTHTDTGGTGTGLMDIWSIKKKYKASLYIYEYASGTNVYTKKISFLFDGKNHFLLKTYRDKEIKNTLIRGDLHVFSNKSE